jgi:phenylalanyl-tRNA synthetase beta chain
MGKVAEYPRFIAKPAAQPQQIIVEKEIQALRPFVVGAVLRGVTFDDARYKSFIDLQGTFLATRRGQ